MKRFFEGKKKILALTALCLFCLLFIGCKNLDAKIFNTNGRFVLLGETIYPRENSSAVLLNDGQVLITGGVSGEKNLEITKSAEVFNPKIRKFNKTGNLNIGRYGHSSILLKDGRVLIVGGYVRTYTKYGKYIGYDDATKTAEIYDTQVGKFTAMESFNKYSMANLILLDDGKVLIHPGSTSNKMEIFDPKINQFKETTSCLTERCPENAIKLNDGTILLTSGISDFHSKGYTPQIFNPITGTIKYIDKMHIPREWSTETSFKNGEVIIIGGSNNYTEVANAEIYDPTIGKFRLAGKLNKPRYWHSSILLTDGKILVVGGESGHSNTLQYLKSAELYDPVKDKFMIVGNLHFTRSNPQLVVLKDGNVFIIGGGSFVNSTFTITSKRPELYVSK